MFVRNAIWQRIREQFAEEEKAVLRECICGETICPPGIHIDDARVPPKTLTKLQDAISHVAPGA